MVKNIIILTLLFCNVARAEGPRKTSLVEATVYTGLPALTITAIVWAKPLTQSKTLWSDFTWGFNNLPVPDNNPWYVNYICHPVFGAESYLLARNRGFPIWASFLYSTSASIVWEYGIESWIGAKPSVQDLLITSTVGSILGEIRYYAKKKLMRNQDHTWNKIGIILLDPINAVYVAIE